MCEKDLMITVIRILLQKGTINEEVFNKSLKKINGESNKGNCSL